MTELQTAQTYQLIIHVAQDIIVNVGKLGPCNFRSGFYIYTGSAKKGLQRRLERHLSVEKKLHWHIDYILAHPHSQIVETRLSLNKECAGNQSTPGEIIIKGLGSSDCRARCGSHLKFVGQVQP